MRGAVFLGIYAIQQVGLFCFTPYIRFRKGRTRTHKERKFRAQFFLVIFKQRYLFTVRIQGKSGHLTVRTKFYKAIRF
jgi:hypothetical protein